MAGQSADGTKRAGVVEGERGVSTAPEDIESFDETSARAALEDAADATTAKVTAAGGAVLAEPFDVMDVGRMSVAADPGGAVFGIWQARSHKGMGLANESASVCWNENMSRDFEANKAFYSAVFGYGYDDMSSPEFS